MEFFCPCYTQLYWWKPVEIWPHILLWNYLFSKSLLISFKHLACSFHHKVIFVTIYARYFLRYTKCHSYIQLGWASLLNIFHLHECANVQNLLSTQIYCNMNSSCSGIRYWTLCPSLNIGFSHCYIHTYFVWLKCVIRCLEAF